MSRWTLDELARLIDHTNLQANATESDIIDLCDQAKTYHFHSVMVNQANAGLCARELEGTDIRIGCVVSFPLGQTSIQAKVFETQDALAHGAQEIDYVVNLTQVKEGNWTYVEEEMNRIVSTCDDAHATSKVIFETCYLTKDEKLHLCEIACKVHPSFVKTSTGFGSAGATVEDVQLMYAHVNPTVKVKAAGGIRDAPTFLRMVGAGARRIGASASKQIIEDLSHLMDQQGSKTIEI